MENNEYCKEDKQLEMPEYVTLEQKYNCKECKLNKRYNKGTFAKCMGNPATRSDCIKRSKIFLLLFNIVTGIIIAVAYIWIYSKQKDLLLSLAYTIIFMVGMDIISSLIEFAVDKIFEKFEKFRENSYKKKVENLKMLRRQQEEEEHNQQEKEKKKYEEIDEAKKLFFRLEKEYFDNLEDAISKSQIDKENKKNFFKKYQNFLKSIKDLLEQVNTKNYYVSEVKILFQVHLPKLMEYIDVYVDAIETDKESKSQREELAKLLEAFTEKAIWTKDNLNKAQAENLVYKMQALREVVHVKEVNEQ